jgi:O-antigen ligase
VVSVFLLPAVVDQTLQRTPITALSVAAFALVAIVALVVTLRRPPLALGLLALAIPFAFYRDIGTVTTLTLEKMVLLGVTIGLLVNGAPLAPKSAAVRRILIAGAVVLVATLLSMVHATYVTPVIRETLKQFEYLLIFWCGANLVLMYKESATWFEVGVVSASMVVVGVALAQALFGGAPSGILVNGVALPRVAGTLEGPNQLAGYLEVALPVLFLSPLLMQDRLRVVRWLCVALSVAVMVLTQSRAGMCIAVLSYAALWLLDRPTARLTLAPFVVGAIAGIGVALTWYWAVAHDLASALLRLVLIVWPQDPGGVGTRDELWQAAIALFQRQPLLGVGAGNFELLLNTVGLTGVQTHANSLWLQTLAEQGLVGLIALLTFVVVSLREWILGLGQSWLARAALLATGGLLLHQVFDYLLFFPKVGLLWWLLLGVAAASVTATQAAAAPARGLTHQSALEKQADPVA